MLKKNYNFKKKKIQSICGRKFITIKLGDSTILWKYKNKNTLYFWDSTEIL